MSDNKKKSLFFPYPQNITYPKPSSKNMSTQYSFTFTCSFPGVTLTWVALQEYSK